MTAGARRGLLIAAGLSAALVLGAAVWWDRSHRGFESDLKDAVSQPYCASVRTDGHGLYGREHASLRREASHRFAAWCEYAGPDVAWYRFPSRAALARALRGYRTSPWDGLCVSRRRREVLLANGVPKFAALCAQRNGRILKRGDQTA